MSPTLGNVLVIALSGDLGVSPDGLVISGGRSNDVEEFRQLKVGPSSDALNGASASPVVARHRERFVRHHQFHHNDGVGAIVQEFSPSSTPSEDTAGKTQGNAPSGSYQAITPSLPE